MAHLLVRQRDGASRDLEISPARSLLNSLMMASVPLRHDCGGRSLCGTCRVRVLSGGDRLSRIGAGEAGRLEAVGAGPGERLACQTRAVRDAEILVLDDGLGRPVGAEAS